MGFFSSLFKKQMPLSREEQIKKAGDVLASIRNKDLSDRSISKQFRREINLYYDAAGASGPLHEELTKLVQEIETHRDPKTAEMIPKIKVISWETWTDPKLKDLISAIENEDVDILYCTAPPKRSECDAVAEAEARMKLASSSDLVMVIIGEEDMMFKTDFLKTAGQSVNPETEEIAQDLMDYAEKTGLSTGFI